MQLMPAVCIYHDREPSVRSRTSFANPDLVSHNHVDSFNSVSVAVIFDYSALYGLLWIGTTLAASLDSLRSDIQQMTTVQGKTEALVQSLKLAPAQIQDMMVNLASIKASSGPTASK